MPHGLPSRCSAPPGRLGGRSYIALTPPIRWIQGTKRHEKSLPPSEGSNPPSGGRHEQDHSRIAQPHPATSSVVIQLSVADLLTRRSGHNSDIILSTN
jgi:hypothetical protein